MLQTSLDLVINPKFVPAANGAIQQSLRSIGIKFAETARQLTTDEDHIVTGRYRRSIGNPISEDGVFVFTADGKSLDVGTRVPYSSILEGRYSILARSYDIIAPQAVGIVGKVFTTYLYTHA